MAKSSSQKHIVIIGGGVIGLCTAFYAIRRGHRVTLLERGGPDHDGCSTGNAGMIVPSHFVPLAAPGMVGYGLRMMLQRESPFGVCPRASRDLLEWGWRFWRSSTEQHVRQSGPLLRDLNLASRACYEQLSDEWGNSFGLEKGGLLMLCKTGHALEEEKLLAERAHHMGLAAQVVTPEEAAKLDPGIHMEVAGGVYFPQDCHLNPGLFLAAVTSVLRKTGAELTYGTEVTDWKLEHGRITAVKTSAGEVKGDEYVIAGGAWSSRLARPLGLKLPMQAGKGYSITVPNPPELPRICSILTEARVAVTPVGGALRFAGTMEITGLDTPLSDPRVRGLKKSVSGYYPAFTPEQFEGLPVWSGLRPCSPDGLPYIGRFRRYSNLSAATGHAMMGMSLGPITGRLMAELLSGEECSIDIDMLSPDRFA